MKLVMVTTYATPSNMRRELLETARARGHEVVLVAPRAKPELGPAMSDLGGRYVEWHVDRTGIDPRADQRAARELYAILTAEVPDVMLVYQIKAVLIAPVVAKLARVGRVVALINGLGAVFDEHGFGATRKARLARFVYGLSLRTVDEIVFQNNDDPHVLRARGLFPPHASWRVVPGSGVDLIKLAHAPPPVGPPTFTLISRLLVSKGVRDFVAAAKILRARYPEARFRLVGQLEVAGHPDGVTRTEIEQWAALGLIEYIGFTDQVASVLADTSVFVLPSYYREGVPRTNLEALAIGRPVVTTDWVGCRETVEDGLNGFLIPPKDPSALAERLERYIREPQLVEIHGRAARAFAERRFDIRVVNELMLDALGLDATSRISP